MKTNQIKKYIIGLPYLAIAFGILTFTSCQKQTEVKSVDFDVAAFSNNGIAKTLFLLTDTVNFAFTGKPDIITFYSGEIGNRYEFKDRVNAAGTAQLQFNSLWATGSQASSLALLVSNDFKGVVINTILGVSVRDTAATNANIAVAHWTDITSRAALSTGSSTNIASGVIDLSDFSSQGKPVFIAFKYTATAGTIQNKWTVTNFAVNNMLADGTTYTNANLNSPASAIINYGNSTLGPGWALSYDPTKNTNNYAWVYTDKTSLVISGATTAALATAPVESWAMTGPIDLTRVTPDAGLGIKTISATLNTYKYKYTTIGSYTPAFAVSNNTIDGTTSVVRKVGITVTP